MMCHIVNDDDLSDCQLLGEKIAEKQAKKLWPRKNLELNPSPLVDKQELLLEQKAKSFKQKLRDMENAEGEVTERITRTVVTHSYETSEGPSDGGGTAELALDTVGASASGDMVSSETAIYDVSSTVISDIALASSSSLSHSYSAVGLDRDLNSFKKRIDANTEEQRLTFFV
ncbi:Spindle- and centromere-associated protein [Toxocara canis]|uniref:Spindle-and centromere-associated protein n=1 Tax=Toxocara canis TaxID=6265 RepID=A0A0B2VFN7_TOXCA|nr:Spindle- and centromere-associated protein [Toxocara canis]